MYTGSDSVFRVTGKRRFYWALQDNTQSHRGGVQPQSTLSSGKRAASLQVMLVWRQGTEFYRGHLEIQDKVDSPKQEEDSVMMGIFATSWLGTESQALMCILRIRGGLCDLTSYLNVVS